ncbi:uncharacterized protein LOC116400228 isoform X2 [Anarrhichthys ocellatus]|uniref:uncharacterized protein LOC116400228 isoform X2 n=1 Tax=Anarrhichthys ocellatus TaxID=433405 RepID=UPI0012EE8BA8|nr:uncharacterized protein LOC116400228 isoform X2 [Anarrhichthys ocellatus]
MLHVGENNLLLKVEHILKYFQRNNARLSFSLYSTISSGEEDEEQHCSLTTSQDYWTKSVWMSKRKYKLYLEPNNTIKIPRSRLKRHLDALDVTGDHNNEEDGINPHLSPADVETTSPSGHFELTQHYDQEDTIDQQISSSGHFLLTSELQPRDVASSPEGSVYGLDSELEDLGEDEPVRETGFDKDMDSVLMSAGTTTKAEALIMIMSHAARHNITGTQLDDLLKLINTLFSKEVLPRSKSLFNKVFQNNSESVEFHYYCKTCKVYIGTKGDIKDKNIAQCSICSTLIEINSMNRSSFFINIPIAPQIQTLLEIPQIQNNMSYRHQRLQNDHVISDIYDGENILNILTEKQKNCWQIWSRQ